MSAKGTSKVLEKLEASINEGNYYEAHQMYRSVLNRYVLLAEERGLIK